MTDQANMFQDGRARALASMGEVDVLSRGQIRECTGQWMDASVSLPPEGVRVLARHTRGTWKDHSDPEGVNYVVVSRQTRPQLESLTEYVCPNNTTYFRWCTFGPDKFFGQDISYWMYFPRVAESQAAEGRKR